MTPAELLRELSIHTAPAGHHHSRPGWAQMDCPYCTPESRHYRLGFNLRGGWFSCWLCKTLPLVPTLARLTGREYGELKRLTVGMETDRGQPLAREVLTGELKLPPGRGKLKKIHRKFLRSRGFDPDQIAEDWNVEGISELGGRYAWSLFIPVHLGRQVVSWTTRVVGEGAGRPRYDTAPQDSEAYPAKRLLYGEEKCGNVVMVVEGPLDVWALGPGAVCTMGAAISRAQIARLVKFPKRYICLDAEPDAQRVARKLERELDAFDGETYNVILSSGKDPSRVSQKELKQLRSLLA
jgi:hypothetical protein